MDDAIVKNLTKYSKLNRSDFIEAIKNEKLDILHRMKIISDDLYYNTGETILSDIFYDDLKEILAQRDPHYIIPVGAKIRDDDIHVKLNFYMGSMDKFKPENEKEISNWISKFPSDSYIIEEKLDGLSCLASFYPDGRIILATRGDGYIGSDISSKAKYLKTIPHNVTSKIKNPLHIRGELIIKKSIFNAKYSDSYANARNMVPALMVTSKHARKGINDVDFIAYEIISENEHQSSPFDQILHLQKLGFYTVKYNIIPEQIFIENTVELLSEKLMEMKNSSLYEIDGIIVQSNDKYIRNIDGNPDYAFAFKINLEEDMKETIVENVDWSVSKWGILKPILKVKPVVLGGVTIRHVTAFNAKYVYENNIGKNAIIKITRSGDVIPFIVEIIHPAEKPDMPENYSYTWNNTGVDIITDDANDIACTKLISHFFSNIGIKQINEGTITKLYNHGFTSILDILAATQEEMQNVEGFGKRLAEIVYTNLHDGMKNASIPKILGNCGIFGFGIGEKKIKMIFDIYPDILEEYKAYSYEKLYSMINNIPGFSDKTTKRIVANIKNAKLFIDNLKAIVSIDDSVSKKTEELKSKTFVFSGFRDKELQERIELLGGKVSTNVSKNTTAVIVGKGVEKGKLTGKVLKAHEIGIPIYSKDEFELEYIKER